MSESERIARAYELMEAHAGSRWSLANRGNQAILAERRAAFHRLLDRAGLVPLAGRRVLEVGSGTGTELAWLVSVGAEPALMHGVDLLPHRVEAARRAFPDIDFIAANAERLEFADATFDLVLALTVFSSILERGMAQGVASEIVRVVKPGGHLLWYDVRYDSVRNPNVKAVPRSMVHELFPTFEGRLETITLLPPLARRLGPATPIAYPMLSRVPPLRSHLVGLLRAV